MPTHSTSLSAQRVVSFESAQGTRLHVLQGRIWLTQTHDPQDHFLHAQQSLELGPGHAVIEADEDSQYTLEVLGANTPVLRNGPAIWRTLWTV